MESSPGTTYNPKGPRAPVAWIGGKYYLARWIIEQLPQHRVYVEPFGGMANVLLKKSISEVEVFNDLDGRVVNFFRVLRDPTQLAELTQACELTPYSREEFTEFCAQPEPTHPVQRAHWFFVRCRQARGGMVDQSVTSNAWATSIRSRREMPEPISKYLSAIDGLPKVADRFRRVVIEELPAVKLIRKYDSPDSVFYCDPPYPRSTLAAKSRPLYDCDMTDDDHRDLLNALRECKGKVLISSYDSELYRDLLSDWHRVERSTHVQFSNSGQNRTEVIWQNYDPQVRC
ncbi:MAG: DNA adenine methylase [Fuerstiella sp.]